MVVLKVYMYFRIIFFFEIVNMRSFRFVIFFYWCGAMVMSEVLLDDVGGEDEGWRVDARY